VAPRLVDFTAGMLASLGRADQRAVGELYARGLLMDGARKSMQPMAERLGVDQQRLQQFITSSTWDYAAGGGGPDRRGDRPAGVCGRRFGVPEGRDGVAVCGPDVLRGVGQGRELSDRGERADGHRHRVGGRGLAAVLSRVLG